jgi:hypothetical protein
MGVYALYHPYPSSPVCDQDQDLGYNQDQGSGYNQDQGSGYTK